jgi:hypothetical protein
VEDGKTCMAVSSVDGPDGSGCKSIVNKLVPVPCAPESQCYEGCVVKEAYVLAFFAIVNSLTS